MRNNEEKISLKEKTVIEIMKLKIIEIEILDKFARICPSAKDSKKK